MNPLLNYSSSAFQFASGVQTFSYSNQGNVFYVRPRTGSDGQDGKSPQTAFKTLAVALGACVANQNDIVYMLAESNTAANTTDYQSVTLDWNKDGVHLIGVNAGSQIGQRSRIANLSSAAALAPMFKISANNCYVANIEFFQGTPGSGATSICMQITGQRNRIENCQISGNGDLTGVTDVSGTRSLKISGSENLFQHCYIGLDTVLRATQTTEVEILTGARNIFENCQFETYTSLSTFKMVSVATDTDRFVKFKDCEFVAVQNITSAVAPTGLIGITTMNGQVLVRGCYMYGFAQYVTADNTYVQMLSWDGTATGHKVGIAQSVDAA